MSQGLDNAGKDVESDEVKLNRKHLAMAVLLFILWSAPIPLVNRPDIWVLGIPLLWFYYIALSLATFATLLLMYIMEYHALKGR